MPLHGMLEKSPEELAEEAYNRESPNILKADFEAEREKIRQQTAEKKDALDAIIRMSDALAKQVEIAEKEASAAKTIAEATKKRADIAEQESVSARKDAKFSKTVSIISLIVSILTAILTFAGR